MAEDAFLDSSVLIGLVFRHAGERAACAVVLPEGGRAVCSRFVIFEVARGFLRSLIALHNSSFEFQAFADLHQAAYSGQLRFKPYQMSTWLGAFTDYFAVIEAEDGLTRENQKLEEFRAKLRGWIRRGWKRMQNDFAVANAIGCRDDIPPPSSRADGLMDQRLPTHECGEPNACGLQRFVDARRDQIEELLSGLESLPTGQKDNETERRIEALFHLLEVPVGQAFDGKQCHRCGDALICLEAEEDQVIATKNRKHFEPIAAILGKAMVVAESSRTTVSPNDE